jgi:hypothetical protein
MTDDASASMEIESSIRIRKQFWQLHLQVGPAGGPASNKISSFNSDL